MRPLARVDPRAVTLLHSSQELTPSGLNGCVRPGRSHKGDCNGGATSKRAFRVDEENVWSRFEGRRQKGPPSLG